MIVNVYDRRCGVQVLGHIGGYIWVAVSGYVK